METNVVNAHATPLPEYLNPQIITAWKAPLRPYKKRAKHVLRFYLAVALLLSGIIIFFGDRILLVPIWALLFLFYVLTITPPPIVENKITQFGVETAGVTMRWEVLSHFYFTQRFGYDVLTLVTNPPYSLYAYMVVPTPQIKEEVLRVLASHILYQEHPQRTFTDRAIDWMMHLIPDDEDDQNARDKKEQTSTTKPELKEEHTEEITSFWKNLKQQMDFMHKDTHTSDGQKTAVTSQEELQKSEEDIKETLRSRAGNESEILTKEHQGENQEVSEENSKHERISLPTSSSSSDPIQMPASLLRHISEPSGEDQRRS